MMFKWSVQDGKTAAVHSDVQGAGGAGVAQWWQEPGRGIKGPPGKAGEHRPLAAVRGELSSVRERHNGLNGKHCLRLATLSLAFWVEYGEATKDYEF